MLPTIFARQKEAALYYFEHLQLEPIERLVEKILQCHGVIFFSGIGKSGLVAEKIAQTFVSTGTKAMFLSPTNAMHGDIGIVSSQDLFLLFSKSGESDELLQLVPFIRNKGATLVSIICNTYSRLHSASDFIITLPFQKELCPFDMAPTTSTVYQMLFGDLLTVALMERRQFTLEQYGSNHPSGRIGRRISLKVEDLMLQGNRLPLARPHQTLGEGLEELSKKRCGCLLIVGKEDELLGIFTDGDLRRSLQTHGSCLLQIPLQDLMTVSPRTIPRHTLAWEAMQCMEADYQRRITLLPVVDTTGKLEGLLQLHDLIQAGI